MNGGRTGPRRSRAREGRNRRGLTARKIRGRPERGSGFRPRHARLHARRRPDRSGERRTRERERELRPGPAPAASASRPNPTRPGPQSQSLFRSYGSNLPTSLTYIILSTRGSSPWRPAADMGTNRRDISTYIPHLNFQGPQRVSGHRRKCGALRVPNHISLL